MLKHCIIKAWILVSILNLFSNLSLGQDTLITRSGDTMIVRIVRSTPDLVEFTFNNETVINSEYKNALSKIIYMSGREENIAVTTKLYQVKGQDDWEMVQITSNSDDVRGLKKLGEVVRKSGWGGAGAQGLGNKDARKKLKKNAARLGASIVLLQEKADTWGVKLVGVAYK